ncbi:hypothetical protein PQD76_gp26 [Stenotrophomonas phage BUCT626]|uniref:Uncharacterized protein n=1 Tax=Stenotrophomonas phage BUCT626 TaxID=2860376 RepID=A0AC61NA36_9CAUD|nr:hypothetical protein PQD76_gp26 [Stenotrophomonas phage BUCT626]QYC96730.1 hypothetical protein [Stenotrophomonas phage BUCT626]
MNIIATIKVCQDEDGNYFVMSEIPLSDMTLYNVVTEHGDNLADAIEEAFPSKDPTVH